MAKIKRYRRETVGQLIRRKINDLKEPYKDEINKARQKIKQEIRKQQKQKD